ncbi:uncharacterized protein LOC128557442 isoform X2 [Mercenaria mercenaria]|uniref:uncharacterized protein LOC128557442 isoform X2 n=1 Tax=Mercenaria mercenaria TaxID=6596 RepID=UPI00234E79D8|nr:uncharacterized protein LOC128557442 isoform X2 [Mercenaria mercenaria]
MFTVISFIVLICLSGLQCSDLVIEGKTHVQTGSTLSLTCNGTALQSQPANLDWFKDEEKLIPNERIHINVHTKVMDRSVRTISSTLTINDMDKQNEGQYKCWISNAMNKYITVHVSGDMKSGADMKYFMTTSTAALTLAVIAFCIKK